jgi:putative FmdB family regulatory protein
MPVYQFTCKKCKTSFDHLCKFDEVNKTKCPKCKSKKLQKEVSCPTIKFTNPKESSKWDSFDYRAGYLMDAAKAERRTAEENSHVGAAPYVTTDDLAGGEGIFDVER